MFILLVFTAVTKQPFLINSMNNKLCNKIEDIFIYWKKKKIITKFLEQNWSYIDDFRSFKECQILFDKWFSWDVFGNNYIVFFNLYFINIEYILVLLFFYVLI